MKDPTPLVNYVSETFVSNEKQKMRTSEFYLPRVDTEFFTSLYTESTVPLSGSALHNEFINIDDNREDTRRRRPVDTSSIHIPSKLYWLKNRGHNISNLLYEELRWKCLSNEAKLTVNKLELLANRRHNGRHIRTENISQILQRNVKEAKSILDQIVTSGCIDFWEVF